MQNEIVIRTNDAGEPDMHFYLREAHVLREQAMAELFTSVFSVIKRAVVSTPKLKMSFNRQPSFGTLLGH